MVKAIQIAREETCCCHMGYFFWLAARVLLYTSSHRHDNTYHGLCYTNHGTLAEMRNSSMGSPWGIDSRTHRTMELHLSPKIKIAIMLILNKIKLNFNHPIKDPRNLPNLSQLSSCVPGRLKSTTLLWQ